MTAAVAYDCLWRVAMPEFENPPEAEIGPTVTAMFEDGPLKGSSTRWARTLKRAN